MNDALVRAAVALGNAGLAALRGDIIGAVRYAAEAGLELVPASAFHQVIDDAAVRRANARADLEEDLKFGPEQP